MHAKPVEGVHQVDWIGEVSQFSALASVARLGAGKI
jgi:hypothetical protein